MDKTYIRHGLDGPCMPYRFKSKKGDGSWIEVGTPVASLCEQDLHYLANRPDSPKDRRGIKAFAIETLKKIALERAALERTHETMDVLSAQKRLRAISKELANAS